MCLAVLRIGYDRGSLDWRARSQHCSVQCLDWRKGSRNCKLQGKSTRVVTSKNTLNQHNIRMIDGTRLPQGRLPSCVSGELLPGQIRWPCAIHNANMRKTCNFTKPLNHPSSRFLLLHKPCLYLRRKICLHFYSHGLLLLANARIPADAFILAHIAHIAHIAHTLRLQQTPTLWAGFGNTLPSAEWSTTHGLHVFFC